MALPPNELKDYGHGAPEIKYGPSEAFRLNILAPVLILLLLMLGFIEDVQRKRLEERVKVLEKQLILETAE